METIVLPFLSLVLTSLVVGHAYALKKQFYPTVVYIINSSPSMLVIYIQSYIFAVGIAKHIARLFFGDLRPVEREHVTERSWYAITETCLAFAIFKNDFTPKFVLLFSLLFFLKVFHWLSEGRTDLMERSPNISLIFHIRILSLFFLLGALDLTFVNIAYQSTISKGISSQIVFGFEYTVLLITIFNLIIKYILHIADVHREAPWDHKAVFLLYTNLVINLLKALLYALFFVIMMQLLTLPIFAIRPLFIAVKDLNKAFKDIVLSRRAIRNMNTLYPDATPEDLRAFDNVCIICREEFYNGATSKKLPCSHIFHASCLRSWFQRQQTCPTCRLNILHLPPTTQQNMQQQQSPPNQQPNQQQFNNMSEQIQNPGNNSGTSPSATINSTQSQIPSAMYPIYFNQTSPFPIVPTFYEGLCDEEIKKCLAAEGVEAKIRYLQNAKTFVDAAILMLQQYQAANSIHQGTQTSEEEILKEKEESGDLISHHESTSGTLPTFSFQDEVPTAEGSSENYEDDNDVFLKQVCHLRLEILNKKIEPSNKEE